MERDAPKNDIEESSDTNQGSLGGESFPGERRNVAISKTKDPEKINKLLFTASIKGSVSNVTRLISRRGADVNVVGFQGMTPLMLASRFGNPATVEALIKLGAKVNAVDSQGMTPLMLASENGHSDTVDVLIRYDAQVNIINKEDVSALMLASKNGDLAMVEALIKAGADVNAGDVSGITSLMIASGNGHLSIVQSLLKTDNYVWSNVLNQNGQSALEIASEMGHENIVDFLKAYKELQANRGANSSFSFEYLQASDENLTG